MENCLRLVKTAGWRLGCPKPVTAALRPSGHMVESIYDLPEAVAEISIVQGFVAAGVCFNNSNCRLPSAMACVRRTNSFGQTSQFATGVLDIDDPRRYLRLFLWPDVRFSLPAMREVVL